MAANIVVNGNFGADTVPPFGAVTPPLGWSVTPTGGDAGADSTFPNAINYPSDQNDAFIGSAMLFQNLSTVAGTTYDISFWVGIDPSNVSLLLDPSATFNATFDGQDVLSGGLDSSSASYGAYTQYAAKVTASGTSTALDFIGNITSGDGPWYLADVDVEAESTSTAAPEPAAVLLLISGLAGLSLVRRRTA